METENRTASAAQDRQSYIMNYDAPAAFLNSDGVIELANDHFLETFGIQSSKAFGKITHEEACETNLSGTKDCPVEKSKRLKKTVTAKVMHRRNNELMHLRYTAVPCVNGDDFEGTILHLIDVSEEVAVKNHLNQAKGNLDVIPTPIIEIDTLFNITYINPAGAAVAGLHPDEIIGKKKCYELFKTPHCKTEKCACAQAMKTDSVCSAETIARPQEGVIVPIKYTGAPLKDAKGNIKGAVEYVLDLTEERKQQQLADEKINNLNTIPTPIMAIDTEFTITYMNPAGAAVGGKTPDECVGMKCYDLFKTPHCKTEKCACAQAMKTDSICTAETIARPQDGVVIPIKYTGSPIKDAKGNIKGALEYVLDITEERKQQQLADEKINNLNTIPTPIMAIDTEFTITYMNPAGAAVGGKTPDECVGMKCYDLFKTPHCKTEKCACAQAMKTDSVCSAETIARPQEGMIVPIKYTGSPIKDAKGNIKGALEYVLDITEERKQKQAADEKINNLNSIPASIMAIDTDYNVTYMNPAGAKMVGKTPDECVDMKCYDLFHLETCKTENCSCSRSMKSDQNFSAKAKARPSGQEMTLHISSAPIKDAKGNIKGSLEYAQDISAQVEVENIVTDISTNAASIVNQTKANMDAVIDDVLKIKESLGDEVKQLLGTSEKVLHMQKSSSEMLELSKKSSALAEKVDSEAEAGKRAGNEAGNKLKSISDSMVKNNEMVSGLVAELDKISSFVDIIKDIAAQTNLLAFNAAIEAARAGDAGRGFAVVADEVRKLAENSSKSAVDISSIVKHIEKDSEETIHSMAAGTRMLDEGAGVINSALQSLDEISNGIASISGSVTHLHDQARLLAEDGENVRRELDVVVSDSNENLSKTESVSQKAKETGDSMESLAECADELMSATEKLAKA